MVEEEKIKCSKEEEYIRKQVFFSLSAHLVTIIIRQLVASYPITLYQHHASVYKNRFCSGLSNQFVRKENGIQRISTSICTNYTKNSSIEEIF